MERGKVQITCSRDAVHGWPDWWIVRGPLVLGLVVARWKDWAYRRGVQLDSAYPS